MNPFNKKFFDKQLWKKYSRKMSDKDKKEMDDLRFNFAVGYKKLDKYADLKTPTKIAGQYSHKMPFPVNLRGFIEHRIYPKTKNLIYLKYENSKSDLHFDPSTLAHEASHAMQYERKNKIGILPRNVSEKQARHFTRRFQKQYFGTLNYDDKFIGGLLTKNKLKDFKPSAFDEQNKNKLSESMKSIEVN